MAIGAAWTAWAVWAAGMSGLAIAEPTNGTVTVPLSQWNATVPAPKAPPEAMALPIDRQLTGRLDRGQLEASLRARFEVRSTRSMPVPVLAETATLVSASLDGRPASLRRDGAVWVIDAPPGRHALAVAFLHGQRTERFARQLDLALPAGGPTAIDLILPEAQIAPILAGGVVDSVAPVDQGTRVRGWLAANGSLALTWERPVDDRADPGDARVDGSVQAVLSLGEDVVVGVAQVAVAVREGEIDRIEIDLPPEVEVLEASGDSVLQWHLDPSGALVVLLRHLADASADARIRYQYPTTPGDGVPLKVPVARSDGPVRGTVGVAAPVGLEVSPGQITSGRLLAPRDVPPEVLALTDDPLRAVVAFDGGAPEAAVEVSHQEELRVSPTRIDDLQGITVLMEDGSEVGKLRLAVRNTARQVLAVSLPPGATLTHCFRDGVPLRPAARTGSGGAPDDRSGRVLVPLTRSDRPEDNVRYHVVASGDMLSAIAQRYYGDAAQWPTIAAANPGVAQAGIKPGQKLTIPALAGADNETTFVLELGWERRGAALGAVGARTIALPALDLEVMAANWHLYLPDAISPVWMSGIGVVPIDGHRADPFSRVLDLLVADAPAPSVAYAGMGSYESALKQRRTVYREEQAAQAESGGDPFPLVGTRWRLRGVLLGTDPPAARLIWLTDEAAELARWAVFALAAFAFAFASRRSDRLDARIIAVAVLVVVAFVGHHLLGVHRRALWGIDLGLAVGLALRRQAGARWTGRPGGCLPAAAAAFVGFCWLAKPALAPLFLAPILAWAHRRHR